MAFVSPLQDELLAELAELEQEELEESMKNMSRLPRVPSSKLPSVQPSQRSSKYLLQGITCTGSISPQHQRLSSSVVFCLTESKKRVDDDNDMQMLAAWATH